MDVLGTLGVSTTGLALFGPTEGPIPSSQQYGDPAHNGLLDGCGGHCAQGGVYHNHLLKSTNSCYPAGNGIIAGYPVLGFAQDGFPILANTGNFVSGYVKTGNAETFVWKAYGYNAKAAATNPLQLDECNGKQLTGDATYSYGYFITPTQFPYIFGCLRGTAGTYSPLLYNRGAKLFASSIIWVLLALLLE